MAIYLTHQISFATKVEAFKVRGLNNQVSVKASDAGIYPVTRSSLECKTRFAHLEDELPARLDKKTSAYSVVPKYDNILHKFDKIHFEAPTLIVEMKSGGEVLHSFGMFETGTSKMGLYAGKPSTEHFRQIMTLGLDYYDTVPAGNVNLSGYAAFVQAWRGINAFFFMGGGDTKTEEPMTVGIGRAAVTVMNDGLASNPEQTGTFVNLSALAFATGIKGYQVPGEVSMIHEPAMRKGSPGFVFPFFREMLIGDPDTPFLHFIQLFKNCLATSAEATGASMEVFRRGFRFLASTHAGKIIQHIYFCINLCLNMGGRMHLLSDGAEYAGVFIEGDDLCLLDKNRLRHSYPADDIEKALEALNSHASAVKELYDAVIEVGRMDGSEETITLEECVRNPRKIRALIQSRGPTEMNNMRETINEKVGHMRYQQTYWTINPENILMFLRYMLQRVDMMDEPMYLHTDVLMGRSSNILEYLSVFGGQAPSFYFGNVVKQIRNVNDVDPNLANVNNKRALPHIPFAIKGLIASALDWATVRRSKAFKFAGPKKNGQGAPFSDAKARDGIITSPQFDAFYSSLRMWVYSGDSGTIVQKGKRKAGEDMETDEAGSSKKPKTSFTFM